MDDKIEIFANPGQDGRVHHKLAVDLYNYTWTLLDKQERSEEEIDAMIHAAHSSRYHWGQAPAHTAKQINIGEWQLSRVYSVLNRPESALWHAQRCAAAAVDTDLQPILIAFVHEALARANAAAGNTDEFKNHYRIALSIADSIDDQEDRDLLLSDLVLEPWYGYVVNGEPVL
jgi:hypothetical protein